LLIICDESQEIKNYRSNRWEAVQRLAPYSSHRALATGTPIAKDLQDEWAQLRWLDESIIGIRYVTTFRSHYCVMGGFENKQVIGHQNLDKFKALTAPYVFRATKEEIGILPKRYNTWGYDLTAAQKKAIREIKRDLESELDSGQIVSVANATVALGKIQQIASGFSLQEDGEAIQIIPETSNPKLAAMCDWLSSTWVEGERFPKAIIWTHFREEAEQVAQRLAREGRSFVRDRGSDAQRAEAVRSFLDPEGAEIFEANPQSAGTGLNLQGLCSRALYYSNSFRAIDRWQSEDRIHRIGTKSNVIYTDLIAPGSLDAYILRNLRQKKGLSDLVLGDIRDLLRDMDQSELPSEAFEVE
jgi:SNF2 family DNA or RNA helicase